jgi:4-diphosphocytidyl-2-C-methyl-D-erythritol kinase
MSVRRARVPAFAKINLSLRVLYKRADGFHELRTVFQTISLADRLEISFTPGRKTSIELESSIPIENNLVLKAARMAMDVMKASGSVLFRLWKRIPMGGGLGGGSTDAAAVLLALPVLVGKEIPPQRLFELAESLGSDVPFFLTGGTALGLGKGEELYPLPPVREPNALLLAPPLAVSTPEAYLRVSARLTPSDLPNKMKGFQSLARGLECPDSGGGWKAFCENDFEAAVFTQYPLLKSLREELRKRGAQPARMSGSGAALYGVFDSPVKLAEASRAIGARYPQVRRELIRLIARSEYQARWHRALAGHEAGRLWPPGSSYTR